MNEEKRRGRPPKHETDAPTEDIQPKQETQAEQATEEAPRDLTFEEVMAWNRANADKLPPIEPKPLKKKRKYTVI